MTLVDNSDRPGDAARLRRIAAVSDGIEVLVQPGNLGYFGGAHWALSRPGVEPALWTVVSNVDLRLADAGFVQRLLAQRGNAAVIAPSVTELPDGRQRNPYLSRRPTPAAMRRRALAFAHPLPARLYVLASRARVRLGRLSARGAGVTPQRQRVFAPHGSFVALHRSFFDAGATLEHPNFLYGEELTLGEQCHLLGLEVIFEPALRVVHDAHASTGPVASGRTLRWQSAATAYGYSLVTGRTLPPALARGPARLR